MRDPFIERQHQPSMDPDAVRKYNTLQKQLGGFPLDPFGSENVCQAVQNIIIQIREHHFETNPDQIRAILGYSLRPEGPFDYLSSGERQRTLELIEAYYADIL